ncbi:unnamed protein product [Urochloa decumbens]|uniref:VQ domain-containing protein n=1 Tax=Urochloa decumbens TaxID=240449 RepID=A0ABC9DPA2_9POAL
MAMEVQGSRRHHQDAGVKVKFIETQFISSDAASFKAVVQRLTGKSSPALSAPPQQPQRPRPCRPAFAAGAGKHQEQAAAGWPEQQHQALTVPAPKQEQEPLAAAAPAPRLEEMQYYELCDFADLFYTTAAAAGARRDGAGSAFPY